MKTQRNIIEKLFRESLETAEVPIIEQITDETVLMESGLDSLGFAILVAQLENELGYDPFTLMDEAIYPTTFGEFVAIYDRFAPSK
jgi:acyl carrier protein